MSLKLNDKEIELENIKEFIENNALMTITISLIGEPEPLNYLQNIINSLQKGQ